MPDAEKCEKVIKGLECCSAMSGDACRKCPYSHECLDTNLPYGTSHLANDALYLLKEQEAVKPKIVQSEDFLWSQWYVCGACEYPVDPGDKFCRECGRELKWDD
jgi:hypothetical protein